MLEFTNLNTGTPIHRLPDLDVHEENGELILRAEMPGLKLGAVDLRIDRDELVLEADGWDGSQIGQEHYEHIHGRLPLPFGTDTTRVTSQADGEVLEVHIPMPPLPEGEEWLLTEEIAY
jgi:HSP20 family molecular chaperone IbpA